MNHREFRRRVLKGGGNLDQEALGGVVDARIEARGKDGSYTHEDVRESIALASRLQVSVSRGEDQTQQISIVPGPRELLDSEDICDRLEPQIRELRRQLYEFAEPLFNGTTRNPLSGLEKATKWLEEITSFRRPVNTTELRKIEAELAALSPWDIERKQRFVQFPERDKKKCEWWVRRFPVAKGTPLYQAASEIERMATASGISAAAFMAWILLGVRPVIPRVRVTTNVSRFPSLPARWSATFTINAQDVTWAEIWQAYKQVRSVPAIGKRRRVKPLHARIYEIVAERGGEPGHGQKGQFWESVRLELKKEKQFEVPTRWESIRKAYRSMSEREDQDNGSKHSD